MLVSVRAETESLRADLDKATAKIKQFENQTKQSSTAVESAFAKITGGQIGAGKLAAGLSLLSSSLKTFGGESVKAQSKLLDAASRIAAGYAAGGPIGAGVVGLTELLGHFAEKSRHAADEARASAEAFTAVWDKMIKSARDASDKVQGRIDAITERGKSPMRKFADEINEAAEALRKLEALRAGPGLRMGDVTSVSQLTQARNVEGADLLRANFQEMTRLRELIPLLEGQQRRAAVAQVLADLKAQAGVLGQIGAMEAELAGERSDIASITRTITDLERERAILARDTTAEGEKQRDDIDKQIALQRQLLTATKSYNAEKANRAILDQIGTLTGEGADYKKRIEEWTRDGASAGLIDAFRETVASAPMRRFVSSLSQDLQSSVADAISDGILTGGKNGADILNNLLSSVLRKTIDSIVGDILKGASGFLGGLLGGGGGGIASLAAPLLGAATGGGTGAVLPLPDT